MSSTFIFIIGWISGTFFGIGLGILIHKRMIKGLIEAYKRYVKSQEHYIESLNRYIDARIPKQQIMPKEEAEGRN